MSTFAPARNPDYQTTISTKYAVLEARFGDGYSQRAADGINNVTRTVMLAWSVLSVTDALAIVAFMDSQAGVTAFDYTVPGDISRKWLCRQGAQLRYEGPSHASVTLTVESVPA